MSSAVQEHQFQHSIKTPCTKRIFELSLPKQSKRTWLTDYGPRILWCNQKTIRPLKPSTLKFVANERINLLAKPKPNHKLLLQETENGKKCDRTFWTYSKSKQPPPTPDEVATRKIIADLYLRRLSTPKTHHPNHEPNRLLDDVSTTGGGRESPIWRVNAAALKCGERPRTVELAKSRQYHPDYQQNKESESVIPKEVKNYEASERTRKLSLPKSRLEEQIYKPSSPEQPIRNVSRGARSASPSARAIELSRSRGYKDGYVGNRSPYWSVSKSARRVTASTRIAELSTPVVRTSMETQQYNPDAFNVKPIALKAMCTERTTQLAQPVVRR